MWKVPVKFTVLFKGLPAVRQVVVIPLHVI